MFKRGIMTVLFAMAGGAAIIIVWLILSVVAAPLIKSESARLLVAVLSGFATPFGVLFAVYRLTADKPPARRDALRRSATIGLCAAAIMELCFTLPSLVLAYVFRSSGT